MSEPLMPLIEAPKWRVILRISYNADTGRRRTGKLRKAVLDELKRGGIILMKKTGTYEGPAVTKQEAAEALGNVLKIIADPRTVSGVTNAHLDHFWGYIEQALPMRRSL